MFVFYKNQILLQKGNFDLESSGNMKPINSSERLPENWQGLAHWLDVESMEENSPDNELVGLRDVWHRFGDETFALIGGAWQWANWFRNVRVCSFCGGELEPSKKDFGRFCKNCRRVFYAPLSPAVIVAVERDNKLLLAHNTAMPGNRFSVIAGFVEPGETLEQTVMREVREEVSVEVKNIKYFGSQSWPFPNSLMLGFTAEWESGELKPDGHEIAEAGWFATDEIHNMNVPDKASISRRLIDNFVATH